MSLHVECFDSPEAFAGLEPEWTALAARLNPRMPFQSWHWNEAWWRYFRLDTFRVKDTLRLFTVRDDAGTLQLVAPMVLTSRPARGPLKVKALSFFGSDPNVTEVRGPICAPEQARDAFAALLHHLDTRADDWHWLEWGGVRWASGGEAALETRGQLEWVRDVPDYLLTLGTSWEALRASRGRNLKEALRKGYNSLKREGWTPELRVVENPAELPAALARFFALHANRAQLDGTVEHFNVFAAARSRDFLTDYALSAAARGETKVFELWVNGQLTASRLGFVNGSELYLYFSGFDPEWGRFSVMTTTAAEAMQWAISRGLERVNLSPGNDLSKTRWNPDEVLFRDAVLLSRKRVGALSRRAFVAARSQSGLLARVLRAGMRGTQ